MRDAGLRLDAGGFWRRPPASALLALAPRLLARAAGAAAAGERTFAVPEAAPVAAWIVARVADPDVRAEAAAWRARGARYHESRAPGGARGAGARPRRLHPRVSPQGGRRARTDARAVATRPGRAHDGAAVTGGHRSGCARCPSTRWGWWRSRPGRTAASCPRRSICFTTSTTPASSCARTAWRAGADVSDAYVDGSTLDARSGRHRSILPAVVDRMGARPADDVPAQWLRMQRLLTRVRSARDRATARAAELLLFEVVHEKGLPAARPALAHALRGRRPHRQAVAKARGRLLRRRRSGRRGHARAPRQRAPCSPAARRWAHDDGVACVS